MIEKEGEAGHEKEQACVEIVLGVAIEEGIETGLEAAIGFDERLHRKGIVFERRMIFGMIATLFGEQLLILQLFT